MSDLENDTNLTDLQPDECPEEIWREVAEFKDGCVSTLEEIRDELRALRMLLESRL